MRNQPIVPESAPTVSGVPLIRVSKLSDEEVMDQLRQGNPDALAILFDRYYRLVLKVAVQILRDSGEAEDLMQEVFLELFNKAAQFNPSRGNAKTWILQYAYHRSLNRRQYLMLRNFYSRYQITEREVSESSSQDVSWRGLSFHEWRRAIEQGLGTLSGKQRKTFELACFQGLLLSEVAVRMQESLPNVRHYYYRGLERLRRFLQEQPDCHQPPTSTERRTNAES